MKLRAITCSTVAVLNWCFLCEKISNSAQAYSLYSENASLNLTNPTAQNSGPRNYLELGEIEQELQMRNIQNGQEVFVEDDNSYEQYSEQVESAIKDGAKIYYSQKHFLFEDEDNSYTIQTIITSDGRQLSILEKTSGEKGPQKAAGMIYRNPTPDSELTKAVESSSTQTKNKAESAKSLETLEPVFTGLELLFEQGTEGKIAERILLPADATRTEITEILNPLIDKHWLTPLQAQGWVGTELFLNLQEARKHPENFLDKQTPIAQKIPLPNNLGASIYQGTSITTVEQSQKKANVALFSLISLDEEKTEQANPDRGIQKVLDYARAEQPSNIDHKKLTSPYANRIRNARNLEDLTHIFNQAGHGQGIKLNLNQAKEQQWLYTSVDQKSPYYIGKVYGQEPTQEQIQTALHIKEWLRASGVQYVQKKLGLDTQDKLANALQTRIQGIHPDIARGVADYLTHKVANPACHENGFCTDLDIPTQSALLLRGVAQKPEKPKPGFPLTFSSEQVFYPGGKKFPPAVPPIMGGGGSSGDSPPDFPSSSEDPPIPPPSSPPPLSPPPSSPPPSLPPSSPPLPPTPPSSPRIPEPSLIFGLLAIGSVLGLGKLLNK